MTDKKMELVAVKDYEFIKADESVKEALADNLGGRTIQAFELDRVTVPAAGGLTWEVPSIDGSEPIKELVGVIAHWQDKRMYWKTSLNEGGEGGPPDCFSEDARIGIGDPGGECAKCPLAEFGSASDGKAGQACGQKRFLYLFRTGDLLPIIVVLPPTSLKAISTFFLRSASKGLSFWKMEVGISLEEVKNKSGMKFSRVKIKPVRLLNDEAAARVKKFREKFEGMFSAVPSRRSDVQEDVQEEPKSKPPERGVEEC